MRLILAADIGGTHANFAVAQLDTKCKILKEYHFESHELKSILTPLKTILKEWGNVITHAYIGAAGPVYDGQVQLTNTDLKINAEQLKDKTTLQHITLVNDFVLLGHVVSSTKKGIALTKAQPIKYATKVVIGAGTGLGKCVIPYVNGVYTPLATEGGHIPIQCKTAAEFTLTQKAHIETFEQALSGKGLYLLFKQIKKEYKTTDAHKLIERAKDKAQEIAAFRKSDPACKKTFSAYKLFYARFARAVAEDTLAFGGMYIAGGIATKDKDLFDKEFFAEFISTAKYPDLIKKIPVFLVKDYGSSLDGACIGAQKEL